MDAIAKHIDKHNILSGVHLELECLLRNCWRKNRLRCAEIGFPSCTTIAASEKSHFTEPNRYFQCNPIKWRFERASQTSGPCCKHGNVFIGVSRSKMSLDRKVIAAKMLLSDGWLRNSLLIEISESFSVWRTLQPINHIKLHNSAFSPLVHSTFRCNSDSIEINNVPE